MTSRLPRPVLLTALGLALAAVAAIVFAVPSGAAVKRSQPATVKSASNSTLSEKVVVNAKGRTLYTLSGETPKHRLCTSAACLKAWPPLLIPAHSKPVAGSGVSGHLSTVKHGKQLQVTLRGKPLYTFVGDKAAGDANGEGITNFGGTWHAAAASSSSGGSPVTPTPTPTATPSPSGSGYGYPPGY
jgi:predicted lipoprotein with Yx(FWY)xxD motif